MSVLLAQGRTTDTIFALATGAGRGAIAVIRLSGPQTRPMLAAMCPVPPSRRAALRSLRAADATLLDQALVLWLPGPGSYTGEDTAELHLHGGRAVIQAVSRALLQAGARPADAGEFTRRAYLAGRMSLLEAEAIAELSASETESQRLQALRLLQGNAAAMLEDWSLRLTRCLAFQEALIDFPDDNLPDDVELTLAADITQLLADIGQHADASRAGERVRGGLVFVIAGAPNVGKSSLFNALAGREAAIVSPRPGTTRDTLEVQLELGGIAVTLVDTAGQRETADEIEAEGVRRAAARVAAADLVLQVVEASATGCHTDDTRLVIASKSDLAPPPPGTLGVSVVTQHGMNELLAVLTGRARRLVASERDPILNSARQIAALRDLRAHLAAAAASPQPELRAEDLRLALGSLGRLSGQVDTEQVLDMVFGAFCIGK